jgi:hypothetical protein
MNTEAIETSRELAAAIERNERSEAALPVGLHEDVPMATYLKIDAASNTALGWLRKSPAHMKAYLEEPPTFVDPESVGSALHCLVLEGRAAFLARYRDAGCDDKRLAAWKEADRNCPRGATLLRSSAWKAVVRMAENVHAHPAARLALEGITATELTGVWDDPASAVRCKLRTDAINPSIGAIVDLKTTRDAAERSFSRAIFDYGYHRQGALYRRGMRTLAPDTEWVYPIIVAIEKDPPYAVAVYRIMEEAIQAGDDEIDRLLPLYRECAANGRWPAYSEEFTDITLPPWSWRQIEDEQAEWTIHQEARNG